MAIHQKTLTLEAAQWCEETADYVGQSLQHAPIQNVRQQVEAGHAKAFHIKASGQIVGAFVLRVDEFDTHSEGVIVAAAAKLDGVDMVGSVIPAIEQMFTNCSRIRYHTASAALARKMRAMGYQAREIVCMKELDK